MTDKGRAVLRIVVGIYLVYLGGSLIKSAVEGQPNNMVLFILAGTAFVIIGGVFAFFAGKQYMEISKAERAEIGTDEVFYIDGEPEDEDEQEETEQEEAESKMDETNVEEK